MQLTVQISDLPEATWIEFATREGWDANSGQTWLDYIENRFLADWRDAIYRYNVAKGRESLAAQQAAIDAQMAAVEALAEQRASELLSVTVQ